MTMKCNEMKDHNVEENVRALDVISHSDVTAADAQRLIAIALSEKPSPDARTVQKISTVLRDWVWHALNERRRDPELRSWYKLIQRQSSYLQDFHATEAERLRLLSELVYTSISVEQTIRPMDIIRRSHVLAILEMLHEQPDGTLGRAAINAELKIRDANLSRVLKLLLASGIIERSRLGRTAEFKLTIEGAKMASKQFGARSAFDVLSDADEDDVEPISNRKIHQVHVNSGGRGKRSQVRPGATIHRKGKAQPRFGTAFIKGVAAKKALKAGALHEHED